VLRLTTSRTLALVAVLLFAGLVLVAVGTQRLASWEVLEVRDPARVRMTRGGWRPGGLQAGQEVGPTLIDTGRDCALALGLDELLMLRMSESTSISLPSPPARWFGRHRTLEVQKGEVVLSSGDRVLGRRLAVRTDRGQVLLEGADLVVRRDSTRVEILLLRGAAELTTREGDVRRLEGMVGLRLREGAPPELIPVDEETRGLAEALPRASILPGD